jgi:hypothetical protein
MTISHASGQEKRSTCVSTETDRILEALIYKLCVHAGVPDASLPKTIAAETLLIDML